MDTVICPVTTQRIVFCTRFWHTITSTHGEYQLLSEVVMQESAKLLRIVTSLCNIHEFPAIIAMPKSKT